jgi:hypothetical protein
MKKLVMILPLAISLCFTFAYQPQAEEVEKIMEEGVEGGRPYVIVHAKGGSGWDEQQK